MDFEQETTIPIPSSPKLTTTLDNELDMPLVPDRPSTPDKCAVCLNNKQMDIIARIDSCAHTFCFACILEWSKVRAICPLCKQAFKLITRERYSGEVVEEVRVQTPQSGTSRRFSNLNEVLHWVDQHRRERPQDIYRPRHRPHDLFRQMVYMEWLNTVQALVHRPNSTGQNTYLTPFVRGTNAINLTDLIPADSIRRLLHRYLRQTTSELRQSTIYSQSTRQTVAFRKYIYLNRVFVHSPLVGHGRDTLTIRECSPTWFTANPACLHRLVPFLARELLALLWNDERTIEHIIQEILTTIQIHEIRSTVLTRKLNEYLGRYTKHFVHEFHTFAACPYDLAGFDRYAQYPNINGPAEGTTPTQIQLDDDDDDEEMPIVIDETNDLAMTTIDLASSSSPSSTTTRETALVSERRSSSPECEIVEYVQAAPERSPTLIVLSEDDDDDEDGDVDVQRDDEEEEEEDATEQNETATSRKRKHRHHHRHSKRTTTAGDSLPHFHRSGSDPRSPESVILDDEEEEPEHIESFTSQQRTSSSPLMTTTATIIYETDED